MPDLKRQFTWTVIPSGRIDTTRQRAGFSLLLTPRLLGSRDTTVKQFAMQSWPRRLQGITITALRAETPIVETVRVPFLTEDNRTIAFTPDQQLSAWRAVFPEAMPVRALSPASYQGRRVNDFPAREAATEIRDAFTHTAHALTYLDGDDAPRRAERHARLRSIAETWQAAAFTESGDAGGIRAEPEPPLRRAYNFYRRASSEFTPIGPEQLAGAAPHDFHDVVARLADHPILLRVLGLLIDCEIPVTALTTGAGAHELRVKLQWPGDPLPSEGWGNAIQHDVRPKTGYVVAGRRFVPVTPPNGASQRSQGMLPLKGAGLSGQGANDRFEVVPFDVDGAALRMFSIAQSERGNLPPSAVPTAGLPTLRSMGFALVDKSRRSQHEAQLRRAKERDTPEKLEAAPLTAEHLNAGYRIDVLEGTQWRSLCQRRVRYTVGGVRIGHDAGQPGLLEEGYVRPDFATTGADAGDALYIHQTVARWDGWSLVIPRPDRVANPTPALSAAPAPGFTVQVDPEPGSLPRLRFGRNYQLRARFADLAGGGLRRGEVNANEEQTSPCMHRRFEPLLAPELAPTARYVDGAGQDQMIIRSDRDVSAAAYAAATGYPPVDVRYLLAPKSSLELAIQHEFEDDNGLMVGVFDSALGPAANPAEVRRQFDIAKRADNDVGDIAGAELIDGGNDSGKYFRVPESPDAITLPWLPDVAVDFTGLRVAEGGRPIDPDTNSPGPTSGFKDNEGRDKFMYKWKGDWPDHVPIVLRVEDADAAATIGCAASQQFSGTRRTFTIRLKPAEQVTVDMVSGPDPDFVPQIGVAHWAGAHATDPLHPVNEAVYRGRNPLVTPPRTVTMIHAVQHPLRDPRGQFIAMRNMGDTHAILAPKRGNELLFDIHVPSTGRIDIRATWRDVEDIAPAPPVRKTVQAIVGSFDIAHRPPKLDPPNGAFPVMRQEFGDGRRRKVNYSVEAISRFRDYFGRLTTADPKACTVKGDLAVTDVPATVRPTVAKIRNIVPAFRWSRSEGGSVIRSSRRGGGLRVLLERPWFVTGADEALAVVAWPEGAPAPTSKDLQQISLAGRDPVWNTTAPPAFLNKTHFNAASTETAVLRELGRPVVAVISPLDFDENFDKEADCWFADIDLSPLAAAAYFPFVRLVLCRYQSHMANPAALDQRLSPPIQTEPVQLFPHRDLTVTRSPDKVSVILSDPNPSAPRLTATRAELQVFQGDPRGADDALVGGSSGWTMLAHATGGLGDNMQLGLPPNERRKLRIAVTESESYSGAGTTSRVVYADIVLL